MNDESSSFARFLSSTNRFNEAIKAPRVSSPNRNSSADRRRETLDKSFDFHSKTILSLENRPETDGTMKGVVKRVSL